MFFGKKAKLDLVTLDGVFDLGPMKIVSLVRHSCSFTRLFLLNRNLLTVLTFCHCCVSPQLCAMNLKKNLIFDEASNRL